MNIINAIVTLPNAALASVLLACPVLADVPFMKCQLERIMPNDARKLTDADLRTYTTSGTPWIEIAGTHQGPDAIPSDPQKIRGFRLDEIKSEKGQSSWLFSNENTSGVMNIYPSGRVDITLHVKLADQTYVELFSGPCKDPS
ncbi:MAG: hypothetical protein R8G34_00900 [Paracoccaceae bacterium]|nr:hypothetical protein [Paracoccaceae bacterium]